MSETTSQGEALVSTHRLLRRGTGSTLTHHSRPRPQCSGDSPRCERCEKRGHKCEYIPCSQQKASSSSNPSTPSAPEAHFMPQPVSPYFSAQSSPGSSTSWQHANGAYQEYFPDTPAAYQQGDHHWQNQAYPNLSPSNTQVPQQQFYGGAPAHSRAARPAYSGEDFNQPTYSYQTYGQGTSVQPTIPSHPGYSVGSVPNGYGAPDAHTGPADPSLSYGYGGHGRAAFQAHLPSQRA
ncbi:uncharacterized protein PHACADRAFT_250218 [Phanerochaete carnosa HHB-10118-sp]|uniref:Zn(2)-C6 fungal-type domain-containing protein n=1 Tax=Phanerochaete carnosa (strain HHB-10118-sp) TaxID=650164 RepID=K5WKC8_PHACS|nr:uncharacterized protein PHACADRAFT_250218 [Phanerochaete carnosa HHB-10118-sp]EKM59609.1 hypothetical protein PHACADRAFT_250218 [Phanerochaete carnosa HHB-10118-sp]